MTPRRIVYNSSVLLFFLECFYLSDAIVQLTQRFSPTGNIILKCSAIGKSAGQSAVRLGCTLTENEICRENCTRTCLIVNGEPDCTQINSDSVISCKYMEISSENIEVVYELSKNTIPMNVQWWCNFRGDRSRRFESTNLETSPSEDIGESFRGSRRVALKSLPPDTEKVSEKVTGNAFSMELIFIIALCTALSCVLNVFLFLRCHFTRKYINKLSRGGQPNGRIESSLCIKNLSRIYQKNKGPRRVHNSNLVKENRVPMTDPVQRRLLNPTRLPMRSGSMQNFVFQPLITETIYDDVPVSSLIPIENGFMNHRNTKPNEFDNTPCSTRKCIVDQNGTVYVALGHVEQDAGSQHGSRSTLLWASELQPSPKIQKNFSSSAGRLQQPSPSTTRFHNRLTNPSNGRIEENTPKSKNRTANPNPTIDNSSYPGIPPIYPQMGLERKREGQTRDGSLSNRKYPRPKEYVQSNASSICPPVPFSDSYVEDTEDEKFYRDVEKFFDTVVNDANPDEIEVPIPRPLQNHIKVNEETSFTENITSTKTPTLY